MSCVECSFRNHYIPEALKIHPFLSGYHNYVIMCVDSLLCWVQVEDREELGEWVGLCKIDKDGKPRKIVKCSCVVIKVIDVYCKCVIESCL